jgi:carbon monoxide dehydrogenase subunit G
VTSSIPLSELLKTLSEVTARLLTAKLEQSSMTVRVERTFELSALTEDVWEVIIDHEKRARSISVIEDFEVHDETHATWHLNAPIPAIDHTIAIDTEDTDRDPPEYVKFIGQSRVLHVVGEHRLTSSDGKTHVTNQFAVEGEVPGIERYFEQNFDDELENLETTVRTELETDS